MRDRVGRLDQISLCEIEEEGGGLLTTHNLNMSSSSRRSLYMVSLIASLFVSPSVEAFVGCKSNFIEGLNILDTARRRGSSSISQLQMNLPGQVSKKVIVTGACMS